MLCAPGNAGIAADARVLDGVSAEDGAAVVDLARAEGVSVVVVGPEAPLVAGVADALAAAGIACFGPGAAGAELEGSKAFCKEIMEAAGVPTASYTLVHDVDAGMAAVGGRYPIVIKADGLAAGKGVIIAEDEVSAREALHALLVERRFGTEQVVVEEFLAGEELSLLAVCDGETALPLASAQDYKRIFDGDLGPNTGGMGSSRRCLPSMRSGRRRFAPRFTSLFWMTPPPGHLLHGVLYAGLMMTADGAKVLEFTSASATRRPRRSCRGCGRIYCRCWTRQFVLGVSRTWRWSGIRRLR